MLGFVALRHARDLDMADARVRALHVALQLHRDIAFDDLAVVDVELHLQIRRADFVADRLRVVLTVQEEAGDVAGVDRLDHDADARLLRFLRRVFEVLYDTPRDVARAADPARSGPAITCSFLLPSTAAYSRPFATLCLNSSSRPGNDAMPRSPFDQSPGGALKSAWVRPLSFRRCSMSFAAKSYGNRNSTALKPSFACGGETVQERVFRVHHRQVCGESWHLLVLLLFGSDSASGESCFRVGLLALPLCGAAVTFFAAAKKVTKETALSRPRSHAR